MVRVRRGAGKMGCLLILLIVAAIGYFGMNVGEAFWKYYLYKDRMRQEVKFAGHRADAVIVRRVVDFADSLGLPDGARNVNIRRGDHMLYIWADYYQHVELPGTVKEIHFNPSAVGTFERRKKESHGGAADPRRKILSWSDVVSWRRAARAAGDTVVFTNGVFDLLHPGHIDVLSGARAEGDRLVVGVNSDASVRRLGKGPERPVRSENERAYVLAALEMVDAVVLFEQDTPLELVRLLEPDVIVKGGDYAPDSVVGAADVVARGGKVVIIPITPGHSTTSTIRKLRELQ